MNRLRLILAAIAIPILSVAQNLSYPEGQENVNLVTGDFSYSLPLLTVPGPNGSYQLKMQYNAGIGVEQEASWVGLGWELGVGAVDRQVNGYPDDFVDYDYWVHPECGAPVSDTNCYVHEWSGKPIRLISTSRNPSRYMPEEYTNRFLESPKKIKGKASKTQDYKRLVYNSHNGIVGPLYFTRGLINLTYENLMLGETNYEFDTYESPLSLDEYNALNTNPDNHINGYNYPNYDSYFVSSPTLSGHISPRIFRPLELYDKKLLQSDFNSSVSGLEKLYNKPCHDDNKIMEVQFRTNPISTYPEDTRKVHFYFGNDNSGHAEVIEPVFNHTGEMADTSGNLKIGTPSFFNSPILKMGKKRHVEYLTQREARVLYNFSNNGYIEYSSDFHLTRTSDKDQRIGAFFVTDENGITYHYALPVYNTQYSITKDKNSGFFYENSLVYSYASNWLLTAITGPDFVDKGELGYLDEEDEGYWVKFEYGLWNKGYLWKNPKNKEYDSHYHNHFDSYSFGTKEVYYLDAIKTKTHTALFVKSAAARNDLAANYNYTSEEIEFYKDKDTTINYYYTLASDVNYELELAKIILLNNTDAAAINKASASPNVAQGTNSIKRTRVHISNATGNRNEEQEMLKEYTAHFGSNILDENDLPADIYAKALNIIDFDYKLNGLCPNAPNLVEPAKGKLSLDKLHYKTTNNIELCPPFQFNYYDTRAYSQTNQDDWGFLHDEAQNAICKYDKDIYGNKDESKAWSLKTINTPMGKTAHIEYEPNNYAPLLPDVTAGAKKKFTIYELHNVFSSDPYLNGADKLTLQNAAGFGNEDVSLEKYFEVDQYYRVVIDYWTYLYNANNEIIDSTRLTCNTYKLVKQINNDNLFVDDLGVLPYTIGGATQTVLATNPFNPEQGRGYIYIVGEREGETQNNNKLGCGIRVKKISHTGNNDTLYSEYVYTGGKSIYTPLREIRFLPYSNLLPGPQVFYSTVDVKSFNKNSSLLGTTRYLFNVPYNTADINNINFKIGSFLETEIVQSLSNIDHKRTSVIAHNNLASLGRLTRKLQFNQDMMLLSETRLEYFTMAEMNAMQTGIVQESFIDRDMIIEVEPAAGDNWQAVDTLMRNAASIQRIYPSILKSITETAASGIAHKTTYENHDLFTGKPLRVKTEGPNGEVEYSESLPAYKIYDADPAINGDYGMGSKLYNIKNKNLFGVSAASYKSEGGTENTDVLGASLSTYKKGFKVIKFDPLAINGNYFGKYTFEDKNHAYKLSRAIGWEGNLNTNQDNRGKLLNFTKLDENSNWGNFENDYKWCNWYSKGENTHYSETFKPIEAVDNKGIYSSSRLGYNNSAVIASAINARYTEFTFSSFEEAETTTNQGIYHYNGDFVGATAHQELMVSHKFAAEKPNYPYINGIDAHLGKHYMRLFGEWGADYKINYNISTDYKGFDAGRTYIANAWINKNSPSSSYHLVAHLENSNTQDIYKTVGKDDFIAEMGNWRLYEVKIDIPTGVNTGTLHFYVKNTGYATGELYFDDIKVQPIDAAVSPSVYDRKTGKLLGKLNNKHLSSKFEYDEAGRLKAVYLETENGFVKTKEYKYNFKGLNN